MQQEIKILIAGLSKLEKGERYDNHVHPYYQLNHIVQGVYSFTVKGRAFTARAGDTLLIPMNSEHSLMMTNDEIGYYFEVKFSSFSKGVKEMCSDIDILIQGDNFSGTLFKEIFDEKNNATTWSEEIMVNYLYSILFKLSATNRRLKHTPSMYIEVSSYSQPVQETIRFLENNYSQSLALDDIVVHTPLQKSRLSNLFKRETTVTIFECLMIIRIRKAVELLSFTNHTLSQISLETGFVNITHFIHVFTKHVMIPPGQFRKHLNSQNAYWLDATKNPIAAATLGGTKIDFSNLNGNVIDK